MYICIADFMLETLVCWSSRSTLESWARIPHPQLDVSWPSPFTPVSHSPSVYNGLTQNMLSTFIYDMRMCQKASDLWNTVQRLPLTLSPLNKLSSATFLACFNFQSASVSLKVGENVVWVSNSLDPDETPSYSASHPDPNCSGSKLFAYGLWLWLVG